MCHSSSNDSNIWIIIWCCIMVSGSNLRDIIITNTDNHKNSRGQLGISACLSWTHTCVICFLSNIFQLFAPSSLTNVLVCRTNKRIFEVRDILRFKHLNDFGCELKQNYHFSTECEVPCDQRCEQVDGCTRATGITDQRLLK